MGVVLIVWLYKAFCKERDGRMFSEWVLLDRAPDRRILRCRKCAKPSLCDRADKFNLTHRRPKSLAFWEDNMPSFATLRLNWEPRMLSILRIIVGLLYMEHGLAKILHFPHQQNHSPYALFTLYPGLQGLLELVGGLLLALVCSHDLSPSSSQATWRLPILWHMLREASSHYSMAGSWQSSTASFFSTSALRAVANGASIDCAHLRRHRPHYRAGPDRHRLGHTQRGSARPGAGCDQSVRGAARTITPRTALAMAKSKAYQAAADAPATLRA
jgi:hypothetical protein